MCSTRRVTMEVERNRVVDRRTVLRTGCRALKSLECELMEEERSLADLRALVSPWVGEADTWSDAKTPWSHPAWMVWCLFRHQICTKVLAGAGKGWQEMAIAGI